MSRPKVAEWITYTVRLPKEDAEPYIRLAEKLQMSPAMVMRRVLQQEKDGITKRAEAAEKILKGL